MSRGVHPGGPVNQIAAIEEVKQWLSVVGLGGSLGSFVNSGYDDLDAISRCNEKEIGEMLEAMFPVPGELRDKLEFIVRQLRRIGIVKFRADPKALGKFGDKAASTTTIASTSTGGSSGKSAGRLYESMLTDGAVFKKYKQGKGGQKRLIWCTRDFGRIMWGSTDKSEIKGFIRVGDLMEINKGTGEGKNKFKIFLVTPTRSLELQASDPSMQGEWIHAFQWLIERHTEDEALFVEKLEKQAFVRELKARQREVKDVLTRGAMFKKFKKSSCTVRKIVFTKSLDQIQWEDVAKQKIKGFILTDDMLELEKDPEVPLRFTITAKERNLTLQAESQETFDQWIDALGFLLQYYPKYDAIAQTY
eukprot:TRINITY_DN71199_c0_g1_i1.p1 TRINITY_DN71199_c0_g1~~TRINITY_DN71199_c0_g1_i1.p1  ORF type:complete len:361 (-),score=193.11 TRINITY_DN71199_c0_g1_i1:40-1122(-)